MSGFGCNEGEEFRGDRSCDDFNNNVGCDFDGGDCCGPNVDTSFCVECRCLDPNFQGRIVYKFRV